MDDAIINHPEPNGPYTRELGEMLSDVDKLPADLRAKFKTALELLIATQNARRALAASYLIPVPGTRPYRLLCGRMDAVISGN